MRQFENKKIQEKWRRTGESLKLGLNPKGKHIQDMTLNELLDIEQKYLVWYPKTDHPDKEEKKHIYENYIKPRIEELQYANDVEAILIKEKTTHEGIQHRLLN